MQNEIFHRVFPIAIGYATSIFRAGPNREDIWHKIQGGHWDNSCLICVAAASQLVSHSERRVREEFQQTTRSHINYKMVSAKEALIVMIAGVNVSDSFWYWLTWVILD